jgi:hypothetical protein
VESVAVARHEDRALREDEQVDPRPMVNQTEEAPETRPVIDQAKGMIMLTRRRTADAGLLPNEHRVMRVQKRAHPDCDAAHVGSLGTIMDGGVKQSLGTMVA